MKNFYILILLIFLISKISYAQNECDPISVTLVNEMAEHKMRLLKLSINNNNDDTVYFQVPSLPNDSLYSSYLLHPSSKKRHVWKYYRTRATASHDAIIYPHLDFIKINPRSAALIRIAVYSGKKKKDSEKVILFKNSFDPNAFSDPVNNYEKAFDAFLMF